MSDFSWPYWVYFLGPMALGLALGSQGVWTWTVRRRHPRLARVLGWGLAAYLLAGALGWMTLLTAEP